MSSLTNTINQLRLLPIFNGNVAGAADFDELENFQSATLPVAYVIPLADEAGENNSMTGLNQIVTERIAIRTIMSNAPGVQAGNDRRGQGVAQQYEQVKFSIFKAILNWRPTSTVENPNLPDKTDPAIGHAARGYRYEGCRPVKYDMARVAYDWFFALEILITDEDGWQPTGQPLHTITFTVTDAITGTQLAFDELDNLDPMQGVQARALVGKFTVMKS